MANQKRARKPRCKNNREILWLKRFLKALGDNIKRYENAHGEIKDFEQPQIPLNCGPTGEA